MNYKKLTKIADSENGHLFGCRVQMTVYVDAFVDVNASNADEAKELAADQALEALQNGSLNIEDINVQEVEHVEAYEEYE